MRTLMFDVHDGRNEVSEALGMSFIRAKALVRLAAGPLTMRELASKLATDPPYTSVVVDDLERRGLVSRSTHADDRRVKVVSITAAGAECAATATEIQNRPPAVFGQLSAADAEVLDRILSSLLTGN
jgi:DNA-binding MarR family transcriptional regulator